MYSPLRENMTRMVKSRAIRVIGLIFGMNRSWYHFLSFTLIRTNRVTTPAMKGMPR